MRPLRSADSALVADVAATALNTSTAHAAKPPEISAFDQDRWVRPYYAQEAA